MYSIKRVLFPIDFSTFRRTPLAVLQVMTAPASAEVTLLHVASVPCKSMQGNIWGRAMTRMEAIARGDFPGRRVVRRIEQGRPADRILEHIRATHTDLVVLPAQNLSTPDQGLSGRVAWEVFAEAPCAVWLDCVPATPYAFGDGPVCCSVDGNESDEYVVQEAAKLASKLGGPLTIVCTLWAEPGKSTALFCDPHVRRREVEFAEARLNRLRQRFAPGADLLVEIGLKESVLYQVIRSHNARLLVTTGGGGVLLAAESICPVWRLARPEWSLASIPIPQFEYSEPQRRTA